MMTRFGCCLVASADVVTCRHCGDAMADPSSHLDAARKRLRGLCLRSDMTDVVCVRQITVEALDPVVVLVVAPRGRATLGRRLTRGDDGEVRSTLHLP